MKDEALTVRYPSGSVLNVFGRFVQHGRMTVEKDGPYGVCIELLESAIVNGQAMSAGNMLVVDPRCVVLGKESGVLFNPRKHYKKFQPPMKKWMQENPQWPGNLA